MSRDRGSFGELLHHLRRAAALSQEEVAARAGLSLRGVSDLERGVRRAPHLETVRRLADALGLTDDERAALLVAARPVRQPEQCLDRAGGGRSYIRPPYPLTGLVGREPELATLAALLGRGDVRLVTLTGPGGVGKTRLAIEAAIGAAETFADGAVFVDLAPLRDPGFVIQAVATALDVREVPNLPLFESVAAFLATRQILLLFDNFEHLLDAGLLLPRLLQMRPGVKALVTSREPLRLHGERVYHVRPLRLPNVAGPVDAEAIAKTAAVTLFVERVRDSHPDFAVTADKAKTISEICRRVDGLPLAIELAAPCLKVLSPEALAARLDRRLPLLNRGPRDAPERQRTLYNAIDWSFGLLSPPEQHLFQCLGVFVGGWTLEAAEAVADDSSNTVLTLASLVDKNLAHLDTASPLPVYRMLATIREYAAERLTASGEEETIRHRHLRFYLDLAEAAESHLISDVDAAWIDRVETEHDNIRAALDWALRSERDADDRRRGLRLAGALWLFWYYHSHLSEGRCWLERALAVVESRADAERAKALVGLGTLSHFQGDDDIARMHLEEAARLWRALDAPVGLAYALTVHGNIAEDSGAYAEAERLFSEARDLFAQIGDAVNVGVTLYHLGVVRYGLGDFANAVRLCAEALVLGRQTGDPWTTATAQAYLGLIYADMGDHRSAATALSEALALYRQIGTLERLAEVIRRTAVLAASAEAPVPALRLFAGADVIANRIGAVQALPERTAYERARGVAERALDGGRVRKAVAAGQAMSVEEVFMNTEHLLSMIASDQSPGADNLGFTSDEG